MVRVGQVRLLLVSARVSKGTEVVETMLPSGCADAKLGQELGVVVRVVDLVVDRGRDGNYEYIRQSPLIEIVDELDT